MAPSVLCAAIVFVTMVSLSDETLRYHSRHDWGPYAVDENDIRHIHSMIDAYRGELGDRFVMETSTVNTKYRAWKRNADFINSILALPKGMNDAGR